MALKKSQLYSSLWQSCDELRGGMDASQYKDYVLTLLFMKYVSDKYAGDRDALIEVPAGGGFADMVQLRGDKEIGDRINKIIGRLAEANDLKGVIDQADFNDESKLGAGKEMQDRLAKLVAIFDGLDFRANRTEGDDLLGDAYEYLMQHFATESGKSKGQFYTPAEVSRIMANVVGIGPDTRSVHTIYEPTCGSGSLLLKAADEAPGGITVYGQEMDNATWALARMNMILHDHPTAELWPGNTLATPYFKNADDSIKTFDFTVANPPFSAKAWSSGLDPANDQYRRFAYGVPPAKNGDYAFLLHLITSLKSSGKGAIILPHGVLFRGNREADIRRKLIRRGFIKGIIGLPANLFYGTGIPACILVIDKAAADARRGAQPRAVLQVLPVVLGDFADSVCAISDAASGRAIGRRPANFRLPSGEGRSARNCADTVCTIGLPHVRWRCLRNSPHSVGPVRSLVARGIALPGRRNRPARSPVLPRLVSLRHPPDYRQRRSAAVNDLPAIETNRYVFL